MQVKTIKEGYYNHRYRKVGEVFDLQAIEGLDAKGNKKTFRAEDQFSEKWMEKIEDESDLPKVKAPAKKISKPIKDENVI